MLSAILVAVSVAALPLTDEVFVADADVRREGRVGAEAVLRGACVDPGAETPAYRLTYGTPEGAEDVVCVWRPWRVGTFLVVGDDEKDDCLRWC